MAEESPGLPKIVCYFINVCLNATVLTQSSVSGLLLTLSIKAVDVEAVLTERSGTASNQPASNAGLHQELLGRTRTLRYVSYISIVA